MNRAQIAVLVTIALLWARAFASFEPVWSSDQKWHDAWPEMHAKLWTDF